MAAGQQQSAYMFALDAASGGVIFKSMLPGQWGAYMAPVAFDGTVYTTGGLYGGLYAFAANGNTLFRAPMSQSDQWTPAVDANSAYVYTGNSLTMVDRKTGVQQGKIDDLAVQSYGYAIGGAPVLASKGMVLAAMYSNATWSGSTNTLMKFNVEKGYVDWRVSGAYPVTPAYADGTVYALNKSPMRLEVRAESDAALRWSWTPPIAGETLWAGEPVVTRNMVFVSTDKNTYAIDLRTRKPVWSYPLAGRLALTRSGVLYIHSEEALVAINVK
jgi:outer membrane protein assembly factor BamB